MATPIPVNGNHILCLAQTRQLILATGTDGASLWQIMRSRGAKAWPWRGVWQLVLAVGEPEV
jgi:hypothetical protein